jgi:hypothetical protein
VSISGLESQKEFFMFKWMVGRVTDILLAFAVVTLLLWYGASHYPELFPRQFFQYWSVVAPAPVSQVTTTAKVHDQ